MGAVRTAGRGRELEASETNLLSNKQAIQHANIPPETERTLTVGLEAIIGVLR
jgi:hypothetical protein